MFLFEITEKGIEKVSVRATSDKNEARDLKFWPIVRRGLQRLNRDLEHQLQAAKPLKQPGSMAANLKRIRQAKRR